jgi:hypothetical protein
MYNDTNSWMHVLQTRSLYSLISSKHITMTNLIWHSNSFGEWSNDKKKQNEIRFLLEFIEMHFITEAKGKRYLKVNI